MAFSLEFRAAVVEFVQEHPELSYGQVATEVGVCRGTVLKWLKAAGFHRRRGYLVRDRPSPRVQAVFDLVDSGMSPVAAARALGMSVANCHRMWARFRPMSPLQRGCRGGLATVPDAPGGVPEVQQRGHGSRLSLSDRVQIEYLLNIQGVSARQIARQLGVQPSTISREITRNSRDGIYDAS